MHYKIVIANAIVAREKEIDRNLAATVSALRDRRPAKIAQLRKLMEARFPERPAGTVHAIAAAECPDGMPNCRNCGDPQFAESCAKSGHCPYCGTRHGIAPDRIVEENGYELVADES